MSFGVKLALFLAVTLVGILGATGLATYASIRATLIEDGKQQVTNAAERFTHQLDDIERRVAYAVDTLSLDPDLRRAVAQRDMSALTDMLRIFGRRAGAARMLLVEMDGSISVDTAAIDHQRRRYPLSRLLDRARDGGQVATVAVVDGNVVWLVIVPVLSPDPIAFVAAEVPLNDEFLARMRELTGLPEASGLAIATPQGAWQAAAGPIGLELARYLGDTATPLPVTPDIRTSNGGESIVLASAVAAPRDTPEVTAVFFYPLSDALRRYQRLILILTVGFGGGLLAAIASAFLVVRGVTRPLELLARYASRIGAGDYVPPPRIDGNDEIGQLSRALGGMTQAIADREKRIRYQADHDAVTNLPNRQTLLRAMLAPSTSATAAVLVIGIIHLQEIANTVGREIAERIMRDAATRLSVLLGAARLGCIGEHTFAAFIPECDSAGALAIGLRIIDAFDQPYRENELTIDASVAIGVAMLPLHGMDGEVLLRRAEVALQAALHVEGHAAVYDAASDPHRPERLSLMSELRSGLRDGELELRYQPKLDLRAGRIAGVEALVRWHHPVRGLIAADVFTGLAEETGNIQYLTRWALETGLADVARWRDEGVALRVSINVSVRDLVDVDLPERVAALLRANGLPGDALVLEVTEGAIMREPETVIAVLRRLVDLGVTISIDDFGVGQSSLAYLRRLPVGEVKIDKAFVLRLARSADDQTIVRSVVELGHSLGYVVTAEGVEDVASAELLRQFGCDYGQGYLIARPLPAAEVGRFVAMWTGRGLLVAAG